MNPFPRTWIDIRLSALTANLALVRERIGPEARLALVAKADAYGHGLVPISRHAVQNGADWICVATVQEGIALVDAGILSPILVLSPILEDEAEQAVFYGLRITLENLQIAEALSRSAVRQGRVAKVHFEIDTGLSRFGVMPDEVESVFDAIQNLPGVQIEGVCQHFVDSGFNRDRTELQRTLFSGHVQCLRKAARNPFLVHLSNSAGALNYEGANGDLVRIGILGYGIDPYQMSGEKAEAVMTWKARLTAIRDIPAGETVGYSETYRAPRRSRIATLGVGYGDGYHRGLSNQGHVLIHGQRAPVVGLICMDQTMVDVTDIHGAGIGDEALLLGADLPATQLAKDAKTNSHEIVTRIMSRVPRRYVP